MSKQKEFTATHKWRQYPGIKFQVDYDTMRIRVKGDNDSTCTNWVSIRYDRNGVRYFRTKGETIYWWDVEPLID